MKIENKFIKLIISGDKQFECRVLDLSKEKIADKEGLYLINGDFYTLKFYEKFSWYNDLLEFVVEKCDSLTIRYLTNNGWFNENFLSRNEYYIVYKWEKIPYKKLEII